MPLPSPASPTNSNPSSIIAHPSSFTPQSLHPLLLSPLLLSASLLAASTPPQSPQVEARGYVLLDSAYVDPIVPHDNEADSVVVAARSFKGPGPFTVHFMAQMTERPDYCAWEVAHDQQFSELIDQFRTLEPDERTSLFDYEFSEQGSYYVRFTADFDSATYNSPQPVEVTISTSLLEVPNLITPDSPSGHNQVFKVKYQSLISFELWVYNRWGQELFHTTDPSEGWDGTHNGSTVPTGAYYYLVKAEGTDGERYVKKGALNVLKTKNNSHSQ